MEEKNIIFRLRREKGLSQEDLAEKVFVTRQLKARETFPEPRAPWHAGA